MLVPIVIVAIFDGPILLRSIARRRDDSDESSNEQATGRDHRRPLDFFERDQEIKTTTDSIEHGEPTSVEFERFFKEILDTGVKDGTRLLIVLDNLDRVRREDARSLLATMQTFTGTNTDQEPQLWSDRVWTLIPFDEDGLDRLWSPATAPAAPAIDAHGKEVERPGDERSTFEYSSVTDAFLDKLFAVRFKAPPMLLTDWRSYLSSLLQLALPDTDQGGLEAIVRLRSHYLSVKPDGVVANEGPTPRQLKQYVNQIGSSRVSTRTCRLYTSPTTGFFNATGAWSKTSFSRALCRTKELAIASDQTLRTIWLR